MAPIAVFARAVMTTGSFMYFSEVSVTETREESEARVSVQGVEGISDAPTVRCLHRLFRH